MSGRGTKSRSAKIARDAAGHQFYGSVVTKGELVEADEIQGIDREISLMRARLRKELRNEQNPLDYELMLKSVDHIVRAVVKRYRMSPQRGEEMAEHVRGLIDGLADSLFGAA